MNKNENATYENLWNAVEAVEEILQHYMVR